MQSKSIQELDPSLALPLVSNAALSFLKRHLALGPGQIRPLEAAMHANSERLTRAEARLASEAAHKVNFRLVYRILSFDDDHATTATLEASISHFSFVTCSAFMCLSSGRGNDLLHIEVGLRSCFCI